MPITHIFLDLDDVLNQFTMQALMQVGCIVDQEDPFSSFDPAWGFDIIQAANALHPIGDFTLNSFWKLIKKDFWANCRKSSEFDLLLTESGTLVGRDHISICTTPIDDPECLAGKLEWIHRYLPKWLHRQYDMTPQKYLLAHVPGALLIDDSDDNVNAFRAIGGQAILVPRPWNSLHKRHTMDHLEEAFYARRS